MIDIRQDHLEIVLAVFAKYVPEYEVWAFGSRVNGRLKEYADLDLVIKTRSKLSALTMAKLRNAFSESDLPFMVDVVDWSRIRNNFKSIILEKYEIIRKPINKI